MKTWELINPSDPITFESDDLEAAALAVILVGSGQYAAETAEGDCIEMFMFGGADQWFRKNFNRSMGESFALMKKDPSKTVAVLRSFKLKGREEPSSLNDIVGFAYEAADMLEGKKEEIKTPKPRSVYTR